ncbi:hypothetical protein GCM10010363_60870 [Streptomyces omiyaensis]|uniref:hypothetical protein n=1 Tax=Streptomyces omiyaensis TaxID=68247 RepID=UPI0016787C42|nr:hypothetical protein [Streptomyces omiyaensis]GGY71388.1 hypothetical protein GCM10010363_60870 [Streptomyces omiyaensis]
MSETPRMWASADRWVKCLIFWGPLLGAGLAALGYLGEQASFWDDHPVGTNLYSSLIAFSVGAPFALLVLSWLSDRQAQTVARDMAFQQARKAARLFAETLTKNFQVDTPEACRRGLTDLVRECRSFRMETGSQPRRHVSYTTEGLAAKVDKINRALEVVLSVPARGSQQKVWFAELTMHWRQLSTAIMPYLDEVAFAPDRPVRIEGALARLTAVSETPFLQMTASSATGVEVERLRTKAKTMMDAAEQLQYLLGQLDDLERIAAQAGR